MKFSKVEFMILGLIILLTLGFFYKKYENRNLEMSQDSGKVLNSGTLDENKNSSIFVHISGRVKNPGLYEIQGDERLKDLIEKAGGPLEDADLDSLNLAQKLKDEEKIVVPSLIKEDDDKDGERLIDINRADEEELQNIPGVGPKMAKKIINYRKNNYFTKIEDLKNLPGIGEKKFEEIKAYIIVK